MKHILLFQLLSLLTITYQQDRFEVLGGSVVVLAGETVTLPCHLKPNISAVNVKVDWTKIITSENILKVHVYKDQKDVETEADVRYRGRTSLFRGELQKGNTSLRLIQATFSDQGLYRCGVQTANWYEEAEVQVSVQGDGSLPVVSIGNPSGWGLEVVCKSTGWHPQPELEWLDSEGQVLPGKHTETSRGQDGLYDIEGVVVAHRKSNPITCRIQQQLVGHMLQTKLDISNDLFPNFFYSPIFWVSISVLLMVICTFVGVLLYCIYKRRLSTVSAQSWARSKSNTTSSGAEETIALTDGKDVNINFMRFAKSHVIQNEKLKKQLVFLNTRKLNYSDMVKFHKTIFLDADSAHADLKVLHEDVQNTRKITLKPGHEHAPNDVNETENTVEPKSDNSKGFKKAPCLLAKDGFSSGSHYFMVTVPESGWIVGVVKASVDKEKTSVCTVQEGCWTLRHGKGKISVHDDTMISLFVERETKTVGVFVNYDETFISFYNVIDHDGTDKSAHHIYTYTNCTFKSEKSQTEVFPFFGIGSLTNPDSKLSIVNPDSNS